MKHITLILLFAIFSIASKAQTDSISADSLLEIKKQVETCIQKAEAVDGRKAQLPYFEEGKKTLQAVFDNYPYYRQLIDTKIDFYHKFDELDQIAIEAGEAMVEQPNCPECYYICGYVFEHEDGRREAIFSYEKAVILDDTYYEVWQRLGLLYQDILIELYEVANGPNPTKSDYERALEMLQKTIHCYRKMVNLKPNEISNYETLERIFTEYHMRSRAREMRRMIADLKAKQTN